MASLETGKSRTESILEVQEAVDLITTYADLMEENDGYLQPLDSFVEDERNADVLRPYGVFARDLAVQLPGGARDQHGRRGADRRQHRGAQALGGDALDRRDPRRDRPRRRAPGRACFNVVQGGPPPAARSWRRPWTAWRSPGSAEVGRWIARTLQEGPYARPALTEMGGKNPAIVTAAADLDKAAEGVAAPPSGSRARSAAPARGRSWWTRCTTSSWSAWRRRRRGCAIGDPPERDMFLGPVVNEASVARFEAAVAAARSATAASPPAARPDRPGHFVEPTVVSGLPQGHALERDELFLPFVTVSRVGSFDEAMAEANAPVYGLTAGIFSEDEAEKERFLDTIEAGVVYVNRRAGPPPARGPAPRVLRLEVERLDRQGRPRPLVPAAVHARAEPHDRGLSSAASPPNAST